MAATAGSSVSIRLTIVRSAPGVVQQWCVSGPGGASWGQVARDIDAPDPAYVGPERIESRHRLGVPPLMNGAIVTDRAGCPSPAHLLDIVAIEGPSVGSRAVVTTQVVSIGRAAGNHLVLNDSQLSRRHCEVTIEAGRAVVRDSGSTNGTRLDGRPVGSQFLEMRAGQRLQIGGTTLALERTPKSRDVPSVDDAGRYLVHRPPRKMRRLDDIEIVEPTAPQDAPPRGFPWVAALVPLLLAGALVLVLGNLMFALFALLSPVMVIAQYAGDRGAARGRHRSQQEVHKLAWETFEQDCTAALLAEQVIRRQMAPALPTATRDVTCRTPQLWHRCPDHEDFASWRVGVGTTQSQIRTRTGSGANGGTRLPIHDVPLTVSMREHAVIGIAGRHRHALAQSALLQLAAWHSPVDLRLVVLCATRAEHSPWTPLFPLPHLTRHPRLAPQLVIVSDDDALATICAALAVPAEETGAARTVVVLDGVGDIPATADLIANARSYGLAVLALEEQAPLLPAACTSVVTVDQADGGRLDGEHFRPDLPVPELVATMARALGSVADAGPADTESQIPDRVDFITLARQEFGFDVGDPDQVRRHWLGSKVRTSTLLGVGCTGPLWVDLSIDGPHALVAGTTGADKSELLQTLIASLAIGNSPKLLSFVLVDYKGGAAFAECARLPHTLGLVTDLDAHLTSRALRSLEAEVRRRERLLGAVGAADIAKYDALAPLQPLARLCIVIDEFRVLAQELPDFIDGLVRIAAVGRSLGIHLVLATQRPAGVVSGDMRANINLRIALRVRDISDSHDVIDADTAAMIPATLPGRAILRTGGGPTTLLQTAWTGAPLRGRDDPIQVARVDRRSGAPTWRPTEEADREQCGLSLLQKSLSEAASTDRGPTASSPWLSPLPSRLPQAELQRRSETSPATLSLRLREQADGVIALGLVDLPDEQRQDVIGWHPSSDGHVSVVGGPRSGRTTAVRTIIEDAARTWSASQVHIYILDGSSHLTDLEHLPQCGAVVSRDELTRSLRLTDSLCSVIRARQSRPSGGALAEPRILLAIDGWEIFQELSNEHTVGELEDRIGQILRDGASVGISVVATGGRGLMSGRSGACFSSTVLLRMTDPSDLLMAGLRTAQIPSDMPPGRGLLLPGGQEIQFAMAGPPVKSAARPRSEHRHTGGPVRIDALPDRVQFAELVTEPLGEGLVPCGQSVGGTAGLPVGANGEAGWLICGPPRSGRTTALSTLAGVLARTRRVGWIGTRCAPTGLPPDVVQLPLDDPGQLQVWCVEHPDAAILIDDLDQLGGFPAEGAVLEHLARNRSTGAIVCASGVATELGNSYRGLAPELRRRQTGILLQPGRHDGDVFAIRVGPADRPRAGRGLLVVRGAVSEIQVATT